MFWSAIGIVSTITVTILGFILVAPKLKMQQWAEAGDTCRIMVGHHRNYTRHSLANARALINKDNLDDRQIKMLLKRQSYDISPYERHNNNVEKLFPADLINITGHFRLLMRNINETAEMLSSFDSLDFRSVQIELFARNVRIAKLSHVIAECFLKIQGDYFPSPKRVEIGPSRKDNDQSQKAMKISNKKKISFKFFGYSLVQEIWRFVFIVIYKNTQISLHEIQKYEIGDINSVDTRDLVKICQDYNDKILELMQEKKELVHALLDPREVP